MRAIPSVYTPVGVGERTCDPARRSCAVATHPLSYHREEWHRERPLCRRKAGLCPTERAVELADRVRVALLRRGDPLHLSTLYLLLASY